MQKIVNNRNSLILFIFLIGYVIIWPVIYTLICPSLNLPSIRIIIQLSVAFLVLLLYSLGHIYNRRNRKKGDIDVEFGYNSRKNSDSFVQGWQLGVAYVIAGCVLGAMVYFVNLYVSGFIENQATNRFGIPILPDSVTMGNMTGKMRVLYLLGGIILGPITEEIVYRKLLYRKINSIISPYSSSISIILTSTIFAMSHIVVLIIDMIFFHTSILYLYRILLYMVPGIAFQVAYNNTQNLRISTAMHIVYNLLCFL